MWATTDCLLRVLTTGVSPHSHQLRRYETIVRAHRTIGRYYDQEIAVIVSRIRHTYRSRYPT